MKNTSPARPQVVAVILTTGALLVMLLLWSGRFVRTASSLPGTERNPTEEDPRPSAPIASAEIPSTQFSQERGIAPQHAQIALRDRWGIDVSSVRLTAGGTALDVRYQVLDPSKAAGMHNLGGETYLLDQISGKNLASRAPAQPLVTQELAPGRTYFMLFPNPGRLVRKGGQVTLVVGGVRTERLPVQ